MSLARVALGAPLLGLVPLVMTGCEVGLQGYSCPDPDPGHLDAQGEPDPCHKNDPGHTDQRCKGECVPVPVLGFEGPALVWFGPEADAPACPLEAPRSGYEGYADLSYAQATCPACVCQPSIGSCSLPSTMTASAALCPASKSGAKSFDFNPSFDWDGACSTTNALPSAAGVHSLTIGPLTIDKEACRPELPSGPMPPSDKPVWATFARACVGEAYTGCPQAGERCAPSAPSGAGFLQCLYRRVDVGDPETITCPEGYTDRHIVYGKYEDQRACSPCECGPVEGSACTAKVTVYKDSVCNAPIVTTTIASDTPVCSDIKPVNSPLGSKSASTPLYMPGTCQPLGGSPKGAVVPREPSVFCCQPQQ